jgi:RimJ/RimL family protein N-acetyltransferase
MIGRRLVVPEGEAEPRLGLQGLRFREVAAGDYEEICQWVNERAELSLIGSERDPTLTPPVLHSWVESATCALVFELRDIPIAFGAGSAREWPLPHGTVEVCHFILQPRLRRHYHGSTFLRIVTRLLISGYGFRSVVARVVPSNTPALGVMSYLRWPEITNEQTWTQSTPFRWFVAPEGELP